MPISFWGQFASPEMEDRFRQHYLRYDRWQAALAFSTGLVLSLAFIPADIRLLGFGNSFRFLLAIRLLFVFVSGICLLVLNRNPRPATLDRMALGWVLLAAIVMLAVGSTRTGIFFLGYAITGLLGLGLLFIVLPLRLPHQVIIGGLMAVVDTLVLLPRHQEIDPLVRSTVMVAYVATVAMGSAASWSLRQSRRQEFAALDRETAVRAGLETALAEVKTLRGILPICSRCKKVRDDDGYWQQVEVYVQDRTGAEFSQAICPDCLVKYQPYKPEEQHRMERLYTCASCSKAFTVASQIRGDIAAAEAPEVPVAVPCPFCGAPKRITWPEGIRFVLAPAKQSAEPN